MLAGVLLFMHVPFSGQVLARPGWAGSGVMAEPWWRSAVVYRLDPARFQDAKGQGRGDLAGVAQRLDYLESLGVDALLLDGTSASDEGFDDLVRAASQHHLRLLLAITPAMRTGNAQALLQTVHDWLSAGVAGIVLTGLAHGGEDASAAADPAYAAVCARLDTLLRSFPGERAFLMQAPPAFLGISSQAGTNRGRPAPFRGKHTGELVIGLMLPTHAPTAVAARQSLLAIAHADPSVFTPVLRFADNPPTATPDGVALAALLLGSRGSVFFDFGNEIGLQTYPAQSGAPPASLPVMQWTPANGQATAPAPIERGIPGQISPGQTSTSETSYGPYRPYVPPPPLPLTGPMPAAPRATVDGNLPAASPAPDSLPGFTTGTLPAPPIHGDTINAATEDGDPHSLLNAYRRLIALHHGNSTLRSGGEIVLNRDAQNAVVWVRQAPVGSRTAADVVAAVNLGDAPIVLALDRDLAAAGAHTGRLRPLFSYAGTGSLPPDQTTDQTTDSLRLPPHAVFVGEVAHPGALRTHRAYNK